MNPCSGWGHLRTQALPQLRLEMKSFPIRVNWFVCYQEALGMARHCSGGNAGLSRGIAVCLELGPEAATSYRQIDNVCFS